MGDLTIESIGPQVYFEFHLIFVLNPFENVLSGAIQVSGLLTIPISVF